MGTYILAGMVWILIQVALGAIAFACIALPAFLAIELERLSWLFLYALTIPFLGAVVGLLQFIKDGVS